MGGLSVWHWLVIGFIVYALIRANSKGSDVERFCKSCGYTGKPESHTPGNLLIEIILWLCFIVPGLIYSIWRLSNRTGKCPKCGSRELVPKDSPVAAATRKQLGINP